MRLPTLYKKASDGSIQEWTIEVYEDGNPPAWGRVVIQTTFGKVGGKMQQAFDYVTEGKNIGKANETSPREQAELEARSKWQIKQKKNYHQDIEAAKGGQVDTNFVTGGIDPMLAHPYDKQGHKIVYPAFMQPKLDGHRCIAILTDGKCSLWSRTRKPITGVPHIVTAIEKAFAGFEGTLVLDGELYNHSYRDNFEELTSYIRSANPRIGHEVVQYWIYDVVMDGTFKERFEALKMIASHFTREDPLTVVWTSTVSDKDEMHEIFVTYLDKGFEGGMLRNANGKYVGKRSYDLQKVKVMQDAEYLVVDIEEGRGKMAGCAVFVCETEDGKRFNCVIKGSMDDRAKYFQDKDKWIGKQLTVKYQNYSADGIPRFPVGLRFREDI